MESSISAFPNPSERDEAIMRDQTKWLLYPFLMLKRYYPSEHNIPVGDWQTGCLIAGYDGIAGHHDLFLGINSRDFQIHQDDSGPTTVERLIEQKWLCD